MVTTHAKETTLLYSPNPSANTRKGFRDTFLTPLVCSVMAMIGMFGGMSALFTGIMCVVVHSVLWNDDFFNRVGTILLVAAIPMILVGSVFLDEIERKK